MVIVQSRKERSRTDHLEEDRQNAKDMVQKYLSRSPSDVISISSVAPDENTNPNRRLSKNEKQSDNLLVPGKGSQSTKVENGMNNLLVPGGSEEARSNKTTLTVAEFKRIFNEEAEEPEKPFAEKSNLNKILFLIEFPFKTITELCIPNVDIEEMPKFVNVLYPLTCPFAIILLTQSKKN